MGLEDPLQLIMIAVVVLVFFMWGPKKIPELARSVGLARKEFNDASKVPVDAPVATAPAAAFATAPRTGDALLDTARKLGIGTEGKTREQVSDEVIQRARGATGIN